MKTLNTILVATVFIGFSAVALCQDTSASKPRDPFADTVTRITTFLKKNTLADTQLAQKESVQLAPYLDFLSRQKTGERLPQAQADFEQTRIDQQVGSTTSSSGTTSVVSKGSVPWLFGIALEQGGLTQSQNGSTVTIRGNVANLIRASMRGNYVESYKLGEHDSLVQYLAKLSFAVSLNALSQGTTASQGFVPNAQNLQGYSIRYDIWNHRDPRDQRYRDPWNTFLARSAKPIIDSEASIKSILATKPDFEPWSAKTKEEIATLDSSATPEQVHKKLLERAEEFKRLFGNDRDLLDRSGVLAKLETQYEAARDDLLSNIHKTPVITFEYNYVKQSSLNDLTITATQPHQHIPDLSTLNLILAKGFQGANGPELTANLTTTLFNSNPGPTNHGRVRDYRAGAQMDVPLPNMKNIGKPTFTVSSLFLSLLQEPLGQQVTVNGVNINHTGNIGLVQAKLTFPAKNSGVKIPISVTYANRTELIKEKDIRGSIGITFNLDSLFASK